MALRNPSFKTLRRLSLTMFGLVFGMGNILYPILVGIYSGNKNIVIGLLGFFITGILVPILGAIGIVLFDGDHNEFFGRIGKTWGRILVFLCMLMLGPLVAMPRMITFSHIIINALIPVPLIAYIFIFLILVFIFSYKAINAISIIGDIIAPISLILLIFVIFKGLWYIDGTSTITNNFNPLEVFFKNLQIGYETLDLIAVTFFSSTLLSILGRSMGTASTKKEYLSVTKVVLKASITGLFLVMLMYIGLSLLGVYYAGGLTHLESSKIFQGIFDRILGIFSHSIVALTVFLAALPTAVGYSIMISEYIKYDIFRDLFNKKIGYHTALIIFLLLCIQFSIFGLDTVISITRGPIVYIMYPVIIVICLLNIAYKLYKFKPIKIPVLITAILATVIYIFQLI